MTYSSAITRFSDTLISTYCNFSELDNCYTYLLSDIADFDLHKLSSLLMKEDLLACSEATGPDNSLFETSMLPSLLSFLDNTTNKCNEIEFVSSWRDGITNYFRKKIIEVLDDSQFHYNLDRGFIRRVA